jgi:GAF domain-containing protein
VTEFPTAPDGVVDADVDALLAEFVARGDRQEPLESLLGRFVVLARRVLPGAAEVSVTLVRADVATTAAATNDVAFGLDTRQYEDCDGPGFDAASAGSPVTIRDFTVEERWPRFVRAATEAGFAALLAVPLPVVREVTGALNVYFGEPGAATAEAMVLARTLAAYAAIAVANVQRFESAVAVAEQMKEAMASRAVIEQAKGIVMAQQRCGPETAFDVLVK